MLVLMYLVAALAAYLLGSVPTGYLAGRIKGLDIRAIGSGNIGATNAFRVLGKTAGATVLLVDLAKGFLACGLLVQLVYLGFGEPADAGGGLRERLAIVAGVAAILGHNYTCWLKFKGGKGIATTAGVILALLPLAFLIALGAFVLVLAITRIVSASSITAALVLPCAVWATGGSPTLIGVSVALGALAIFKHKSNIQRLLSGTEPRIGQKKPDPNQEKQKS